MKTEFYWYFIIKDVYLFEAYNEAQVKYAIENNLNSYKVSGLPLKDLAYTSNHNPNYLTTKKNLINNVSNIKLPKIKHLQ